MFYLLYKNFWELTKTERRILAGAGLVFLLSGFFIVINTYYQNTIEHPVIGGTLKEGIVGQPAFINPLLTTNASNADRDLIEIIFSSLDDLAKNYQVSEDNRSWTITLKDNLQWSDSKPITADDIVYTLEIIQNPTNNHPLFMTWQGVAVERLNENEIRFSLKTPYVFLIDNFKELKIAPRHIFESIPFSNFYLSSFNLEPISSGPYKFESFHNRRDGFITKYNLIPNEFYFGDKPFIEKITFKFYENTDDLIVAFNQRKIDAAAGLDEQTLNELRVNHRPITINLPRYYAIFFNPNIHPAFKEIKVRKALAMAINKKKISEEIFDGKTIIIDGPIPPSISGYDRSVYKNEKYNPQKAEEFLDSSGWTKKENNVRMDINLIVPQIPFLERVVEEIKKDWATIGVELNSIILNTNDIDNVILRTRNYEAIIFGNVLKKNPDIFSFWHSSEQFYPGHNLALYSDKQVDNLLESIRQDFDNDSRQKKLSQLQKMIKNDQPAIFLFSPNYTYAVPKNLQGFNSHFTTGPAGRFNDIGNWYLKTDRSWR